MKICMCLLNSPLKFPVLTLWLKNADEWKLPKLNFSSFDVNGLNIWHRAQKFSADFTNNAQKQTLFYAVWGLKLKFVELFFFFLAHSFPAIIFACDNVAVK